MNKRNYCKDVLFGIAVGDALGVPVEFLSREEIRKKPIISMRGYGTHEQPVGTWSDDSSLAFCLAESLCTGYDLKDLANRFVNWKEHAYWTPHGKVFDIGFATSQAIWNLKNRTSPLLAGGSDEQSNGNGSLMRILPLVFYLQDKNINERFNFVKEVSSLTHRHIRSIIGCFIYLEFALELLKGNNKIETFINVSKSLDAFFDKENVCSDEERFKFHRILSRPDSFYDLKPIYEYEENEISSSGYVVHTLEASMWCFLTTENYKEAVLKAVNLGSDTDTTGAVTGGLSGLYYGYDSIPKEWIDILARKTDIEELALRLEKKFTL
ncbi:MAG TPA: ADP-ribosylglycohydrolase family protein [Cytophagaceae bacterium]|jgi:ADP-ribosyl-[dinitrogen reductase] hydrolase|nr:ADP-ribosylglycohydrolase family protein [Cytophagaceae bacterium]